MSKETTPNSRISGLEYLCKANQVLNIGKCFSTLVLKRRPRLLQPVETEHVLDCNIKRHQNKSEWKQVKDLHIDQCSPSSRSTGQYNAFAPSHPPQCVSRTPAKQHVHSHLTTTHSKKYNRPHTKSRISNLGMFANYSLSKIKNVKNFICCKYSTNFARSHTSYEISCLTHLGLHESSISAFGSTTSTSSVSSSTGTSSSRSRTL